jgi:hypothetical protein
MRKSKIVILNQLNIKNNKINKENFNFFQKHFWNAKIQRNWVVNGQIQHCWKPYMRCICMLAAGHLKKRSFHSVLARIATIYGIWKQWNQRVHGSNTFISLQFDQSVSVKWYHTECTKLRLLELCLLYWPFKNDCFHLQEFIDLFFLFLHPKNLIFNFYSIFMTPTSCQYMNSKLARSCVLISFGKNGS